MNRDALLIYDGDCAFCKNSLRLAIKHLPDLPRYAAYQKLDLESIGLDLGQVQAQVWLIDGSRKLGGHLAVAWMFSNQKNLGWKSIGWLLKFFSPISACVYAWVAKNRHRLPGGTKECSIEDRP
jgi:predicted DCC family thiol-disulfide oxidoreductase YuxK